MVRLWELVVVATIVEDADYWVPLLLLMAPPPTPPRGGGRKISPRVAAEISALRSTLVPQPAARCARAEARSFELCAPPTPIPWPCARMCHPLVARNPPAAANLLRLLFLAHACLGVHSGRALPPRQLVINGDDSARLIPDAPPPPRRPWVHPHTQVSRMFIRGRSAEDQL